VAARSGWLIALGLLLAACSTGPAYTPGAERFTVTFTAPDAWNGPRSDFDGASFDRQLEDGLFRIGNGTERYAWALNTDDHTDIILETRPRLATDAPNRGYGLGCRMTPDGSGYYFLVSRDGYHAILSATASGIGNLTDWTLSSAINTGVGANNVIRAICVGDTLLLEVNGERLAATADDRHTRGASGLVVAGGSLSATNVAFSSVTATDVTAE
jgi:hypothetical protein